MSNIENLLYSAYQHGKRDEVYKKVGEIRSENKEIDSQLIKELIIDWVWESVIWI